MRCDAMGDRFDAMRWVIDAMRCDAMRCDGWGFFLTHHCLFFYRPWKQFDNNYLMGSCMVLGGLLAASLFKKKQSPTIFSSKDSNCDLLAAARKLDSTKSFDNEDPTVGGQLRYKNFIK